MSLLTLNLVRVCKASHTTHDTKDIVVGGVDTDLSGSITSNSIGGKYQLKGSIVNSGHVTCTRCAGMAEQGRSRYLHAH